MRLTWNFRGIVFMLMGGLPLLVMLPATVCSFTRERERPQGWPIGMPLEHMQRVVARVQPVAAAAGGGGRNRRRRLERLAKLHERGALTDEEYAAAKRMLL